MIRITNKARSPWLRLVALGLLPLAVHAVVLTSNPVTPATAKIAKNPVNAADTPDVVTHQIASGGLVLGISDHGGGYINRLTIPALGGNPAVDIAGPETDRYGRGGQSAFRDFLHSLKYNPTQAGFTDDAGTWAVITNTANPAMLTIERRPACLYRGDGEFDFTEWEDLADDKYADGGTTGRNTDADGLNEATLVGQQATEITSEWDYSGNYKDVINTAGNDTYGGSNIINIPTFRHYYEYVYARPPGHAIQQHKGARLDPNVSCTDISNTNPVGTHLVNSTTTNDMGIIRMSWAMRMDTARWNPDYRWSVKLVNGVYTLQSQSRATRDDWMMYQHPDLATLTSGVTFENFQGDQRVGLIILAESNNANTGRALGFYFPNSPLNKTIVGEDANGPVYTDDRRLQFSVNENRNRAPGMQLFGFDLFYRGILNPNRTPPGVVEKLRGEVYILYGTPQQIFTNAQRIRAFSLN